ncbi:1-phosphatidylinositol 4,5-bisphosphate phosphodiesterase gamma-1 [Liparis tanakae]|uniref:1-phosphatidylinositol 4,5-bisphosphate phosphodiesterase gamma-1 n=1 Tax=Liparis tanakae TaxID=230148 RepID=A0A4Z2E7G3_9TELE|nr:1-phosphatidylinositol 4,5-bisphosphate phosphodiesterase gamma-1 [Liparis tanakae]
MRSLSGEWRGVERREAGEEVRNGTRRWRKCASVQQDTSSPPPRLLSPPVRRGDTSGRRFASCIRLSPPPKNVDEQINLSKIDIREIKEIRPGQKSRDFERYAEDSAARLEPAHCFVILYGSEFRLKSLSLAATSDEEMTMWLKGLNSLLADTLRSPTPLQIER